MRAAKREHFGLWTFELMTNSGAPWKGERRDTAGSPFLTGIQKIGKTQHTRGGKTLAEKIEGEELPGNPS